MSVTQQRRNEYSEQFICRLLNEEAAELKKILSKEKITYADFVRQSIINFRPSE